MIQESRNTSFSRRRIHDLSGNGTYKCQVEIRLREYLLKIYLELFVQDCRSKHLSAVDHIEELGGVRSTYYCYCPSHAQVPRTGEAGEAAAR